MAEQRKNAVSNTLDREKHVLLVLDGNAHNLCYLSVLLQRFDYYPYTAMTAKEALEALTAIVPSLILTSLNIKDMDSLKLMQLLKKSPVVGRVPFITITKHGNRFEETRSFLCGAVDCLEKPVTAERLYRAVETVVGTTPRTSIRIRTVLPVEVAGAPHEIPDCTRALDLSERGMFLACEKPAALNTRLNLVINLNGRRIPVEAVVLHTDWTGAGPYQETGMGVEFAQIAPDDQDHIRKYIVNEVMRGIKPGNA